MQFRSSPTAAITFDAALRVLSAGSAGDNGNFRKRNCSTAEGGRTLFTANRCVPCHRYDSGCTSGKLPGSMSVIPLPGTRRGCTSTYTLKG